MQQEQSSAGANKPCTAVHCCNSRQPVRIIAHTITTNTWKPTKPVRVTSLAIHRVSGRNEQSHKKKQLRKRFLKLKHKFQPSKGIGVVDFWVFFHIWLFGCLASKLECFCSLSYSRSDLFSSSAKSVLPNLET